MADDDEADRMLAARAMEKAEIRAELRFVRDGEDLLDYCRGQGAYADEPPPRPDLILLDLNMPRKDGRETLRDLKADPDLRTIPVTILTTSRAEEDVQGTYRLGANSYVTKPVTFTGLVALMKSLGHYWLDTVELPGGQ
jgi:CheY-like chemotaxis protein